jgi:cyclophilin family peptidyl-prolyl cis-trans isomerase
LRRRIRRIFIETARGTIEFELAVLDAPQTSRNFMTLARKGFFNGLQIHRVVPNFVVQDGDPRGDGEGGPGYTIRDELNERPFLRGTVGMALSWRDTGGSQFFITHSPQPHLDARTRCSGSGQRDGRGRSDSAGRYDQRVRVWDGKRQRCDIKQKGATAAPFLAGEAAYRFLPPFFFPPLAAFFAIALSPLHSGIPIARSSLRIAAPLPPGTPACLVGAHRLFA